jgi:hypothetical protein
VSEKFLKLFLISTFCNDVENAVDYYIDNHDNVYYKGELIFTNFDYTINDTEDGVSYDVYAIPIKSIEYVTLKFNLKRD